jgi:hypothetical protein
MSWKGGRRDKSCRFTHKSSDWRKEMEHLLAHHVVGHEEGWKAKVQPMRLVSMEFTSRVDCGRWLNSGFMFTSPGEDVNVMSWTFIKVHLAGTE